MYGRGGVRVLEGVVELKTMSLFEYSCKNKGSCFFVRLIKGDEDG
jgi:hypothetical protein